MSGSTSKGTTPVVDATAGSSMTDTFFQSQFVALYTLILNENRECIVDTFGDLKHVVQEFLTSAGITTSTPTPEGDTTDVLDYLVKLYTHTTELSQQHVYLLAISLILLPYITDETTTSSISTSMFLKVYPNMLQCIYDSAYTYHDNTLLSAYHGICMSLEANMNLSNYFLVSAYISMLSTYTSTTLSETLTNTAFYTYIPAILEVSTSVLLKCLQIANNYKNTSSSMDATSKDMDGTTTTTTTTTTKTYPDTVISMFSIVDIARILRILAKSVEYVSQTSTSSTNSSTGKTTSSDTLTLSPSVSTSSSASSSACYFGEDTPSVSYGQVLETVLMYAFHEYIVPCIQDFPCSTGTSILHTYNITCQDNVSFSTQITLYYRAVCTFLTNLAMITESGVLGNGKHTMDTTCTNTLRAYLASIYTDTTKQQEKENDGTKDNTDEQPEGQGTCESSTSNAHDTKSIVYPAHPETSTFAEVLVYIYYHITAKLLTHYTEVPQGKITGIFAPNTTLSTTSNSDVTNTTNTTTTTTNTTSSSSSSAASSSASVVLAPISPSDNHEDTDLVRVNTALYATLHPHVVKPTISLENLPVYSQLVLYTSILSMILDNMITLVSYVRVTSDTRIHTEYILTQMTVLLQQDSVRCAPSLPIPFTPCTAQLLNKTTTLFAMVRDAYMYNYDTKHVILHEFETGTLSSTSTTTDVTSLIPGVHGKKLTASSITNDTYLSNILLAATARIAYFSTSNNTSSTSTSTTYPCNVPLVFSNMSLVWLDKYTQIAKEYEECTSLGHDGISHLEQDPRYSKFFQVNSGENIEGYLAELSSKKLYYIGLMVYTIVLSNVYNAHIMEKVLPVVIYEISTIVECFTKDNDALQNQQDMHKQQQDKQASSAAGSATTTVDGSASATSAISTSTTRGTRSGSHSATSTRGASFSDHTVLSKYTDPSYQHIIAKDKYLIYILPGLAMIANFPKVDTYVVTLPLFNQISSIILSIIDISYRRLFTSSLMVYNHVKIQAKGTSRLQRFRNRGNNNTSNTNNTSKSVYTARAGLSEYSEDDDDDDDDDDDSVSMHIPPNTSETAPTSPNEDLGDHAASSTIASTPQNLTSATVHPHNTSRASNCNSSHTHTHHYTTRDTSGSTLFTSKIPTTVSMVVLHVLLNTSIDLANTMAKVCGYYTEEQLEMYKVLQDMSSGANNHTENQEIMDLLLHTHTKTQPSGTTSTNTSTNITMEHVMRVYMQPETSTITMSCISAFLEASGGDTTITGTTTPVEHSTAGPLSYHMVPYTMEPLCIGDMLAFARRCIALYLDNSARYMEIATLLYPTTTQPQRKARNNGSNCNTGKYANANVAGANHPSALHKTVLHAYTTGESVDEQDTDIEGGMNDNTINTTTNTTTTTSNNTTTTTKADNKTGGMKKTPRSDIALKNPQLELNRSSSTIAMAPLYKSQIDTRGGSSNTGAGSTGSGSTSSSVLYPVFPFHLRMLTDLYWVLPILNYALLPISTVLARLAHPDTRKLVHMLFSVQTNTGDSTFTPLPTWCPLHADPTVSSSLYRRLWLAITTVELSVSDTPIVTPNDVVIPYSLHNLVKQLAQNDTSANTNTLANTTTNTKQTKGIIASILQNIKQQRNSVMDASAAPNTGTNTNTTTIAGDASATTNSTSSNLPTNAGAAVANLHNTNKNTILDMVTTPQLTPAQKKLVSLLDLYTCFTHISLTALSAIRCIANHSPSMSYEYYTDAGASIAPSQELVHAALAIRLYNNDKDVLIRTNNTSRLQLHRSSSVPYTRKTNMTIAQLRAKINPTKPVYSIADDRDATRDLLTALLAYNQLRPGAGVGKPFGRYGSPTSMTSVQAQVQPSRYSSEVGLADAFVYRRGRISSANGYTKRKGSTKNERTYYKHLTSDIDDLSQLEALYCIAALILESHKHYYSTNIATALINDIPCTNSISSLASPMISALHLASDNVIRSTSTMNIAKLPFTAQHATGHGCSENYNVLTSLAPTFIELLPPKILTTFYTPITPNHIRAMKRMAADIEDQDEEARNISTYKLNTSITKHMNNVYYLANNVTEDEEFKCKYLELSRVLDAITDITALTSLVQLNILPTLTVVNDTLSYIYSQIILSFGSRYDRVRFKAWQFSRGLVNLNPCIQLGSPVLLTALSATYILANAMRLSCVLETPSSSHIPVLSITSGYNEKQQINEYVTASLVSFPIAEFEATRQLSHTLFKKTVTDCIAYTNTYGSEHDAVKLTLLLGSAPQHRNQAVVTYNTDEDMNTEYVQAEYLKLASSSYSSSSYSSSSTSSANPLKLGYHRLLAYITTSSAKPSAAVFTRASSLSHTMAQYTTNMSSPAPSPSVDTYRRGRTSSVADITNPLISATDGIVSSTSTFLWSLSIPNPSQAVCIQFMKVILPHLACRPLLTPFLSLSSAKAKRLASRSSSPPNSLASSTSYYYYTNLSNANTSVHGNAAVAGVVGAGDNDQKDDDYSFTEWSISYPYIDNTCMVGYRNQSLYDVSMAIPQITQHVDLNGTITTSTNTSTTTTTTTTTTTPTHKLSCVSSELFTPRISAIAGLFSSSESEINAKRQRDFFKHEYGPILAKYQNAMTETGLMSVSSSRLLVNSTTTDAMNYVKKAYSTFIDNLHMNGPTSALSMSNAQEKQSAFCALQLQDAFSHVFSLCKEYNTTYTNLAMASVVLTSSHVQENGMMYGFHKTPLHSYAKLTRGSIDTDTDGKNTTTTHPVAYQGGSIDMKCLQTETPIQLSTRVTSELTSLTRIVSTLHKYIYQIAAIILFDLLTNGMHTKTVTQLHDYLKSKTYPEPIYTNRHGLSNPIVEETNYLCTKYMETSTTSSSEHVTQRIVLGLNMLSMIMTECFSTSVVRTITSVWSWLLTSLPSSKSFVVALDRNICNMWLYTIVTRTGIFSSPYYDSPSYRAQHNNASSFTDEDMKHEVAFITDSIFASSIEQSLVNFVKIHTPHIPVPSSPLSYCLCSRHGIGHAHILSFLANHQSTHLSFRTPNAISKDGLIQGNVLCNIAYLSMCDPYRIRSDPISIGVRSSLISFALGQTSALAVTLQRELLSRKSGLTCNNTLDSAQIYKYIHIMRTQCYLTCILTYRILPLTPLPDSVYYTKLQELDDTSTSTSTGSMLLLPKSCLLPIYQGRSCGVYPNADTIQYHVLSVADTVYNSGTLSIPKYNTTQLVKSLVSICDRIQLLEPSVDKIMIELYRLLSHNNEIQNSMMSSSATTTTEAIQFFSNPSLNNTYSLTSIPYTSGNTAHFYDSTVTDQFFAKICQNERATYSLLNNTNTKNSDNNNNDNSMIDLYVTCPQRVNANLCIPIGDTTATRITRENILILTSAYLDQVALVHDPLHVLLRTPDLKTCYNANSAPTRDTSTALVSDVLPDHPYSLRAQCGNIISNISIFSPTITIPVYSHQNQLITNTLPALPHSHIYTKTLLTRYDNVSCGQNSMVGVPKSCYTFDYPVNTSNIDVSSSKISSKQRVLSEHAWISRLLMMWSIHPSLVLSIIDILPPSSVFTSIVSVLVRSHTHVFMEYSETLQYLIADTEIPSIPTGLYMNPQINAVLGIQNYGAIDTTEQDLDTTVSRNMLTSENQYNIPTQYYHVQIPTTVPVNYRSWVYLFTYLPYLAPASLAQSLTLLTPPYALHKPLVAYAIRSIRTLPGNNVWPCLPQFIQTLRFDCYSAITQFLKHGAEAYVILAHCVAQACQAELAACNADLVDARLNESANTGTTTANTADKHSLTHADADKGGSEHTNNNVAPASPHVSDAIPGTKSSTGEWVWSDPYVYEHEEDENENENVKEEDKEDTNTASATATEDVQPEVETAPETDSTDNGDADTVAAGTSSTGVELVHLNISSDNGNIDDAQEEEDLQPVNDPLSSCTVDGRYRVIAAKEPGLVTVPNSVVDRALLHVKNQYQQYVKGAHYYLFNEKSPCTDTTDIYADVISNEGYFSSLRCTCALALSALDKDGMRSYLDQMAFIQQIVDLSGHLVKIPKAPGNPERNQALAAALSKIRVRPGVYPPTEPEKIVTKILPNNGRTLQSAAKVPILVTFELCDRNNPEDHKISSVIFKSHDDIRQDALALQIIGFCQQAYSSSGTELKVIPYRVLPTSINGIPGGVIECVPNASSRHEIGVKYPGSLKQYYSQLFGKSNGRSFLTAQREFLLTLAGYAVSSYILQVKDRHNGNIMINDKGQLIHIDFGFIFDISPGGDMRFENAAFKLTKEMVSLLGGGNLKASPLFAWFVQNVLRGFLATRTQSSAIVSASIPMLTSTLKCFKGGYQGAASPSIQRLRDRLGMSSSDFDAAKSMLKLLKHANNNWRTNTYDWIQAKQQNIYYWKGKDEKQSTGQLYEY